MPASKPTFVGGTNPTSEVPVAGGSLLGRISNMPMEMMQSPGNMFSGKGPAGSPGGPAQQGQPTNFAMQQGGGAAPGGGQAQQVFGGQPFGQTGGTQIGGANNQNLYSLIAQMLYGQGG